MCVPDFIFEPFSIFEYVMFAHGSSSSYKFRDIEYKAMSDTRNPCEPCLNPRKLSEFNITENYFLSAHVIILVNEEHILNFSDAYPSKIERWLFSSNRFESYRGGIHLYFSVH